jgi:hypothetical protein
MLPTVGQYDPIMLPCTHACEGVSPALLAMHLLNLRSPELHLRSTAGGQDGQINMVAHDDTQFSR